MPSSRLMVRLVALFALGGVFAISAIAATPATSKTPAKKHPHRRPYVRPGETAPAISSQPSGSGVEVINGTNVRTEYFPEETQGNANRTRVEVINGSVRHTQVFETDRALEKKRTGKEVAAATQPAYSVKIINGNQWETRAFSSAPEKTESIAVEQLHHEPAVVGISSSESETAEANRKPVVVGIASSDSQDASGNAEPVVKRVTSNGSDSGHSVEKPVVTGVSPQQPKRPPYQGPGNPQ